jgi:hypothetical protein
MDCSATQDEIDDNIATVECLGPIGYELRKAAIEADVARRLAERSDDSDG